MYYMIYYMAEGMSNMIHYMGEGMYYMIYYRGAAMAGAWGLGGQRVGESRPHSLHQSNI